jgi:hypothetical protein
MAGADGVPTSGATQAGAGGPDDSIVTPRGVLLGALMCVAIGVADPYWTFYLHSSTLFLDYSVAGAVFLLFLLVLIVNGGVGMLWRRAALSERELLTVTGMMLVGGAITTMGLVGYLIPNITAPYYLATAQNDWNNQLWPYLAKWMSPLDPNGGTMAIAKYFKGVDAGDPIPWLPWVRPLLLWSLFLGALYACMSALMAIMRKQWVEYEHLSYPIAQVPEALCAAAASPWRKPSLLASWLFWAGCALPVVVGSLKGLNHYFPTVPAPTTSWWFSDLAPIPLIVYLSFAVLGFTFLIPNRVAFSVWSLNIVSFLIRCWMKSYGFEMVENLGPYGAAPYPVLAHVGMGGMLVFIAAGLWFARAHLARVFRCAMGTGNAGYDAGEPCSYRTALLAVLVGCGVMTVWMACGGLSPFHSAVLVVMALLVFFGLTRVVAQCGVAVTIAPLVAPSFMASTFGAAAFSHNGIGMVAMSTVWSGDIRTSVMGSAAHGMFLARRGARRLLWVLLLAALITFATACTLTIWLGYRYGASNLHAWFFVDGPRAVFESAIRNMGTGSSPNVAGLGWTGVGAGLMLALVTAQRMLFWWPIHPVGFIICSVFWTDVLWFSILLAWLLKLLVLKLGGSTLYAKARQFFLGMIMGQFAVAGVWALVDTITSSTNNSIFWI